jgi:hypothetical protein
MKLRRFAWIAATTAMVALPAIAQKAPTEKAAPRAPYKVPKHPWGEPNLQGMWPTSNLNFQVPLQRPVEFGERTTLTDEELKARQQAREQQAKADQELYARENANVGLGPPSYWVERGVPVRQTSLIVDPPDGRLPPLTANALALDAARTAKFNETYHVERKVHGPNDSWIDDVLALVEPAEHNLYVRCISRGIIGSMFPSGYNNGVRITQAPGFVMIENEMIHESRVIPTDGRPHVDGRIRSYMGNSVGHWEGDALVVETTNFLGNRNGTTGGNGGGYPYSAKLKYTERLTRISDDTIMYQGTMDDPETWMKPWTVRYPLTRDDKYVWSEYACHEGNYALHDILVGARGDIEAATKGK